MIDTIRVAIYEISEDDLNKIKSHLQDRIKIDNNTGEVLDRFTVGQLSGSYDYRISVRIKDEIYLSKDINYAWFFSHEDFLGITKEQLEKGLENITSKVPVAFPCREYIEIEFSLAKWSYGVNVFNTPLLDDLRELYKFRLWMCNQFDIWLPDLHFWELLRIDMSINYDLVNLDRIRDYISLLRMLDYPRRKKPAIYDDTVYIAGHSTTVKLYAKQPEFKKHDLKRLRNGIIFQYGCNDDLIIQNIKEKINTFVDSLSGMIRFEVEFHKRKLRQIGVNTVKDILKPVWGELMKVEMARLIGEAPAGKIFTLPEVTKRVEFAKRNGLLKGVTKDAVISVWTCTVTHGKKYALKEFGKSKFYRVNKILKTLSIGYVSTLVDKEKHKMLKKAEIINLKEISNYKNMRKYNRLLDGRSIGYKVIPQKVVAM